MVTLSNNGTQTAVISTEHTIFSTTVNRRYEAYIDLANMAGGDTTELRAYAKIKSGGSFRQFDITTYSGAQTSPLIYIAPLPSDIEYKITLKQTAGTGRAYDWRVYET